MPRNMSSGDAKEFERLLEAFILVEGEGDVQVGGPGGTDPVHVAVVYDVVSYGPHTSAIYVDQNRYHASGDTALQAAYEILEQWELDYQSEAAKTGDTYLKDLQEEWGDEWMEIMTETFDGQTFQMSAEEFADIYNRNKEKYFSKVNISITVEEPEEPEEVDIGVKGQATDARMQWVVTKDKLVDDKYITKSEVGRGTFKGNPGELPYTWRVKDDDGEIYYYGKSDRKEFEPLEWAQAHAGATSIEYKNEAGQWETL